MFILNADVSNGVANGTLCYLKSIHLKSHMTCETLAKSRVDGFNVNTVAATDISHLLCHHHNNNNKTFKVEMQSIIAV